MQKTKIAADSAVFFRNLLPKLLLLCSVGSLTAAVRLTPLPQYYEPLKQSLLLTHSWPVRIHLGPTGAAGNEKLKLSGNFLRHELAQTDPSLRIEIQAGTPPESAGTDIYLWDYSADRNPGVSLNFLDLNVLSNPVHYGQSYVLRTPDQKSMWVVGSTGQGVLFGTMSVLQLIQKNSEGLEIDGAYIRDFPDFQYRAAADWLLHVEVNRWALDWGQGIDGYRRVCEQQLDEALRFKINMVVFDGFGWGLERRFAEYGELMRHLNQYARARGIRLLFGGYGARYAMAASGEYMGRAWKNQVSYPDGPTYQCMGSTLGTCRANDALNRLKAEELRRFVQTIEPGALYIHHEDVSLNEFEPLWKQRDARCRKRWPNDSLTAPDGAAGGLAHSDSQLINAINTVRNPDGYDASRDCTIILVSPGYGADSVSSADWSNTLEFWRNIGRQLPHADNILICFGGSSISFTFPQEYGGEGWIHLFNSIMAREGLHIGTYVFLCGGADNFYSSYPLTGTPALNALYEGATGMYNATGDFYREPMEVINAEYTWNTHPGGVYQDPRTFDEAMRLNLLDIYGKNQPRELFGAGSLYQRACELLYGPKAGAAMESYYRECAYVPDSQSEETEVENLKGYLHSRYLPSMSDRVYAIPEHWKDLRLDSDAWGDVLPAGRFSTAVASLGLSPRELHHRLARHWTTLAQLNGKGAQDVEEALGSDPRPSSVEGLKFLATSFQVDQPLLEALADFHRGMEAYFNSGQGSAEANTDFQNALQGAKKAHELALQAFPHPIDPLGAEVGAVRDYSAKLAVAIEQMLH